MSPGGAFGLLMIILASCAMSSLLTPGVHGLIASSILLALYLVVAGASIARALRLSRHGEGS